MNPFNESLSRLSEGVVESASPLEKIAEKHEDSPFNPNVSIEKDFSPQSGEEILKNGDPEKLSQGEQHLSNEDFSLKELDQSLDKVADRNVGETKEVSVNEDLGKTVEIGRDGGRYQDLKDAGFGHKTIPPIEVHHIPSAAAIRSLLERVDGPAIVIDCKDHRMTASCGGSIEAREYQNKQAELIKEGKFREAFQMDVDDIRSKFGDKYDEAISKAEAYIDKLEKEGKI